MQELRNISTRAHIAGYNLPMLIYMVYVLMIARDEHKKIGNIKRI